jgi:ABC-type amino acid transport system permease subunit
VANTGAPVTLVTAMALLYLAMTLPLTALARRLERRLAGPAGPGTGA